MPPIIVLSCVFALTTWLGARPARGQDKASTGVEIEIRGSAAPSETCLTSQQLRARVAHYSSPGALTRGVRLILYIRAPDAAELHIMRGESVVSRRSFTQLPAPCADRRDAVALSIALALERAAPAALERAAPAASERAVPAVSDRAAPAAAERAARAAGAAAVGSSDQPSSGRGGASGSAADGGAGGSSAERPVSEADGGAERANAPAQPTVQSQPVAGGGEQGALPETQSEAEEPEPEGPIVLGTMPTTTARDPRRQSTSPLQLHLGGRLTLEAIPTPVWVGAFGIELPLSAAVTLGLTALVSTVSESLLAGAVARASFLGLEAVGCGNIALGVFLLQVCAGAAVALCEVSGRNYPRERPEATLLWAAGLGRVTLRWPRTGSFALRALLQPHLSISRPELRVEGSSERLRSFWIGGTTGLELWLALP